MVNQEALLDALQNDKIKVFLIFALFSSFLYLFRSCVCIVR